MWNMKNCRISPEKVAGHVMFELDATGVLHIQIFKYYTLIPLQIKREGIIFILNFKGFIK